MFFSLMHKKVLARKILTNTKSCRTTISWTVFIIFWRLWQLSRL